MLKKVPFSVVFLATILTTALLNGSLFHEINPAILQTFGFSTQKLLSFQFYTVFTMLFLVSGPLMLFGILIIIIGSFLYEYYYGFKRALFMFLATHLTGFNGLYLLALVNFPTAHDLDVGASVGFWGMSGAVVGRLKYKEIFFLGLVSYLLIAYIVKSTDISNIEHPISFIAGMTFQKILSTYGKNKTKR